MPRILEVSLEQNATVLFVLNHQSRPTHRSREAGEHRRHRRPGCSQGLIASRPLLLRGRYSETQRRFTARLRLGPGSPAVKLYEAFHHRETQPGPDRFHLRRIGDSLEVIEHSGEL